MELALSRVKSCPFGDDEIRKLKEEIVDALARVEYELRREEADRADLPMDFRFLDLLLRCARSRIGKVCLGVRVDSGVRMPRLQAQSEHCTDRRG